MQRDCARHTFTQCAPRGRRLTALACSSAAYTSTTTSFSQPKRATNGRIQAHLSALAPPGCKLYTTKNEDSFGSNIAAQRTQQSGELKDYAGAAGGLFGTYRIPASLFAGASAGAAFAMPIVLGEAAARAWSATPFEVGVDGIKDTPSMRRATERQRWVSPRFRSVREALVCQCVQVIVVSTVALERLSRAYDKETSVESFMRRYFDLEWIAVRLNFFVGVLSFVTAIGSVLGRGPV